MAATVAIPNDYKVTVLADSTSPHGVRLTTLELVYPRFIHAEMLRHRVFSHAVASSRAIPPEKLIERVREQPFVPQVFNNRVKGMGVGSALDKSNQLEARRSWLDASRAACNCAERLLQLNVDKSRVNRLLEPFLWLTDIVTATEFDNFFALRDHPAAQPEFQVLARKMAEAMFVANPGHVGYGEWHMPKILDTERGEPNAKEVSVRRVARVSFDRHTDSEPWDASVEKAGTLLVSGHMSPFEAVARPFTRLEWAAVQDAQHALQLSMSPGPERQAMFRQLEFCGNLRGWVSMRKEVEGEDIFSPQVD